MCGLFTAVAALHDIRYMLDSSFHFNTLINTKYKHTYFQAERQITDVENTVIRYYN